MACGWQYSKRIQQIKEAMLNMETNRERWDYMCDTCKHYECDLISDWAMQVWPDFGPPDFPAITTGKIGKQ